MFSSFFFLFDIGQLFCVVRLGSMEPLLCAALLPIAGVHNVHHCDAALCVLIVGGGPDTPSPCEISGIGPDKERWEDGCDYVPLCEQEEVSVAGVREARHCGVACILDSVLGSTMHLR